MRFQVCLCKFLQNSFRFLFVEKVDFLNQIKNLFQINFLLAHLGRSSAVPAFLSRPNASRLQTASPRASPVIRRQSVREFELKCTGDM